MLARLVTILLGLVLLSASAATRAADIASLKDSPAGQRVLAYLEAFNSGDSQKMAAFLKDNIIPDGLIRRPVEERVERYKTIFSDIGQMTPRQVGPTSANSIIVYVTDARGEWLELGFDMEPKAPYHMIGLRIERLDAPPDLDQSPVTLDAALTRINQLVDSLSAADRFSGTVLVAHNDKPLISRAVGLADIGHQVPNRLDTKFNLGSINKTFTKLAIAQLMQQGKVRLEAPLGEYLKDYPNQEAARKVTVRHLIEMTSGIGDFFGRKFDDTPKNRLRTNDDFIPLFADQPLTFEPGTNREYSNGSYILLGAIVQAVSGKDYHQYVREHICAPAGMTNTDSYEADAIVDNLAQGYTYADNQGNPTSVLHANIYTRPARGSAAGGGYSTVEDLHRYAQMLRQGKLLDKRHTVWFLTGELPDTEPADLSAALANGGLGIAGGSLGINAVLEDDPATGYTIVVMSNYDPPSAESLGRSIRGMLRRVRT